MSWDIAYTDTARRDLRDLHEYIANSLCAQEAADGQAERIMKEIRTLDEMPMRYRRYDGEPWKKRGLRFFPVDNYLIFYLPEEMTHTVYIVRIMYGGRDVRKQLKETKLEY